MISTSTSILEMAGRLVKMQVQLSMMENDMASTFTGHKMVEYNTLNGLPEMEWLTVGNNGKTIRLPHENSGLLFLTCLSGDGGYVGPHMNDTTEIVHVLSGEVYEVVSKTTFKSGQTHRIEPGVSHYYIAKSGDVQMLVEIFEKNFFEKLVSWIKNKIVLFR